MTGRRGSADVMPEAVAGIVSRTLAAVVDLLVVLVLMGAAFLAVAGVRFLVSPIAFRWPSPSWTQSVTVSGLLAVGYLTVGWAIAGRSYGGAVLGLRVRSARGAQPGWVRAGLRAVLCVVFPLGLAWAVVSRRRRSLQDLAVGTVVVYDWEPRDGQVSPPGGVPGGAEPVHRRLTRVEEEPP
ncbi:MULTISPECIES: RDD family protein [Pseudonocardia]|nr:RDD family protein [Pseudonocardia dioxanivorans]